MSRVVRVPATLDESSFETLVQRIRSGGNPKARLLLDARTIRWISPYGLIGLLAVGQEARLRTGLAPLIEPPRDAEVLSYINRMRFWPAAAEVFDLKRLPKPALEISDALIEITSIRSHEDVHSVVEGVRDRAQRIALGVDIGVVGVVLVCGGGGRVQKALGIAAMRHKQAGGLGVLGEGEVVIRGRGHERGHVDHIVEVVGQSVQFAGSQVGGVGNGPGLFHLLP